jgi:hypothetical protein
VASASLVCLEVVRKLNAGGRATLDRKATAGVFGKRRTAIWRLFTQQPPELVGYGLVS